MQEIDITLHIARQKTLQDERAHERLVKSLNQQKNEQPTLRERLGRQLTQMGEHLLKR